MTSREPRGFGRFRKRAEELAKDEGEVQKLLEAAVTKAKSVKADHITKVRADFLDMLRMVKAYFKGDYRRVPWATILTAVAGALYFVNPFDLIPDFIVGPGLLDDATVLAFCLKGLRKDLAQFVSWEFAAKGGPPA